MKILETKSLVLRHQRLEDLDALYALYCDPEIKKYVPDAPQTYDETIKEIKWHRNGHPQNRKLGLWATVYKETGKYVGRCGLLPWVIDGESEVEVAYLIAREYWGQGLGTEAAKAILEYGFDKLNLPRLVCLIDHSNQASIRIAEKIGMVFEKTGQDEIGSFLLYARSK